MRGDEPRIKANLTAGGRIFETLRFGLVGALAAAVFQCAFVMLDRLGWSANGAAVGSYLASAVFHFSAHRYFTFTRARHSPLTGQLVRYGLGVIVNYAIVAAALNLLLWADVPKYYASFFSITTSLASSYFLQKFFVYRS